MPTLNWSEALELGEPLMDDTHREFVELLAQARASDDAGLLPAWKTLIEHTEAHFGQEDAWMRSTRFSASNCHTLQHRMVLQVMHEGTRRAEQGDIMPIRLMGRELAMWFPQHAQSMDASLAAHLRRLGFDPETGAMSAPHELPAQEIHGCGGATCS
ncbi:MAG TPA: hemerythrin domain-containing protein [Ramlibacter sp.]|nr:hemerythrin domain-containing protein [Ramlibacter sp.]